MKFLNYILQFLKKPFPLEETFEGMIRSALGVGVFIVFFLYIFQPFDLDELEDNLFWFCLGFGLITFITSLLFEFIFGYLLKIKQVGQHYTFGKWILYTMGMVLCISIANFVFTRLTFFGYINWEFLPYMIRGTFAVGLFPMIATGTLALLRQEKKYERIAEEINKKTISTNTSSPLDQSVFDISIQQIKYIEALQNYVKIGYINTAGQLIEQTERATLKGILNQYPNSPIVKCHRSFLVNREAIVSTSGNAQGLLLSLSDCAYPIPVSRSFVPLFRAI